MQLLDVAAGVAAKGRPEHVGERTRRQEAAELRERIGESVGRDDEPAEQQETEEERVGEGERRLGPQRSRPSRGRAPRTRPCRAAAPPTKSGSDAPAPGRQPKATHAIPTSAMTCATTMTSTVSSFAPTSPVRPSGDPPSRFSTPYERS